MILALETLQTWQTIFQCSWYILVHYDRWFSQQVISNIIESTDNILQTPTQEFKLAQDSSMANTRILNSLDFHLLFAHRGNRNFIRTEDNVAVWTESVPRNSTVTYSVRNGSARVDIAEDEVTADENYASRSDDVEASISLPTDVYWYDTSLGGWCYVDLYQSKNKINVSTNVCKKMYIVIYLWFI